MKRIYILLLALLPLFVLTSCKMEDSEERSSLKLAKLIYERSNRDMEFMANSIMDAVHFNKLLSLESEAERAEYQSILFPNSQISEHDGVYTLRFNTSYNSYSSLTFSTGGKALGKAEWRVEYNSGDSYEAVLKPIDSRYIQADMSFANRNSSGHASLQFEFTYIKSANYDNMPIGKIGLTGELTAIDKQASSLYPVTLRTNILTPLVFDHDMCYFTSGSVYITCHDAIYDATDHVRASYYTHPSRIIIECNGGSWTLQK